MPAPRERAPGQRHEIEQNVDRHRAKEDHVSALDVLCGSVTTQARACSGSGRSWRTSARRYLPYSRTRRPKASEIVPPVGMWSSGLITGYGISRFRHGFAEFGHAPRHVISLVTRISGVEAALVGPSRVSAALLDLSLRCGRGRRSNRGRAQIAAHRGRQLRRVNGLTPEISSRWARPSVRSCERRRRSSRPPVSTTMPSHADRGGRHLRCRGQNRRTRRPARR